MVTEEAGTFHDEYYVKHIYPLHGRRERRTLPSVWNEGVEVRRACSASSTATPRSRSSTSSWDLRLRTTPTETAQVFGGTIGQSELAELLDYIVERVEANDDDEGLTIGTLRRNMTENRRNEAEQFGGLKQLVWRLGDDERIV